jgi:hypothetical protein
MRTTIDLNKPFPFTYPWIMWPGIALVFPFVWIVTAFIQSRQHTCWHGIRDEEHDCFCNFGENHGAGDLYPSCSVGEVPA